MDKKQVLYVYCLLRQIERSIDNRLPIYSDDWHDVNTFFQSEHHEELNNALGLLKSFLGGANQKQVISDVSQALRRRFYHRLYIVADCKRMLERMLLTDDLKTEEGFLILSVFERFEDMLRRDDLDNQSAISVRDDAK